MTISWWQEKGPRYYQEDYFWHNGKNLMMMADGHGGKWTAERVRNWFSGTPWTGLEDGFKRINEVTKDYDSGSTLSVVEIKDNTAFVGILGDSPVIIIDDKGNANISPEHNVRSNKKEAEAVKARGGIISGGYAMIGWGSGGLQMSRALGDVGLSRILSREPEIYSVPLGPDSVILVASDGVVDPGHTHTNRINGIITMMKAGHSAKDMIGAIQRLEDNATAIVWRP